MPDILKLIKELENNVNIMLSPNYDKYDKRMANTTAKNRLYQIRDWLFETDISMLNEKRDLNDE